MVANKAVLTIEDDFDSTDTFGLTDQFGECSTLISDDIQVDEDVLRREVELASGQFLEPAVCDYLRHLIQNRPFFIKAKGNALKLMGEVEKLWLEKDNSTLRWLKNGESAEEAEESAQELRQCVAALMKPFIRNVPIKMKLRARVDLWKTSQTIPDHGTAPAIAFAINGETGQIHSRFYGNTFSTASLQPVITIPYGLTMMVQPFRHGDEAWIQCQGGGHFMSDEKAIIEADKMHLMARPAPSIQPR